MEQRNYKIPTDGEIRQFVTELDGTYLACRTTGHHWNLRDVTDVQVTGRRATFHELRYLCRCGAEKIEVIDATGAVKLRKLDYSGAPGYLATGMGRLPSETRGHLRLETVKRFRSTTR